MKKHIIDFTKGIAIGISNVVPGFSGGTMAVILGVYNKFIDILSNLFKRPIKAIKDGWDLFLGLLVGIVIAIFTIAKLLEIFPVPISFFFIGLVIASLPGIIRSYDKKIGIKLLDVIVFILAILVIVILPFLNRDASITFSFWIVLIMFMLGMICAAAMVIPGVSGSLVLMAFGYYAYLMTSIRKILDIVSKSTLDTNGLFQTLAVVISFAVGAVIGIVFVSKLISFSLKKRPNAVYATILGLVVASPFAILYSVYTDIEYKEAASNTGVLGYIISGILLIVGAFLVFIVPRLIKDKEQA